MQRNTLLALGAVGLVILAVLAFGVFGIQSAFIDDEVSEANPFETTGASGIASDDMPQEQADEMNEFMEDNEIPAEVEAVEEMPDIPEITTISTGQFIDRIHVGTGTANVITDGTQRFLRFEDDFAIDNGPDLNVYLVRGVDADGDAGQFDDDFIDLGDLTGNIGAQNYELDPSIDLDEYDTVVIWCVRFGVAFNAADLV
jgi:hypothetical protein